MQYQRMLALLAAMGTTVLAYDNNCLGSPFLPYKNDCYMAISQVRPGAEYQDKSTFTVGNCQVVYKGEEDVSGQLMRDTALRIMHECGHAHHGSYGTDHKGCEDCHVKINRWNVWDAPPNFGHVGKDNVVERLEKSGGREWSA